MRSTLLKMDLSLLCLIIFSRLGRSYDQPRGGMWKGLQTFTQLENDHVGDDTLMCQHY
jgi:hypothetical protein